jgi:hypothetical protein
LKHRLSAWMKKEKLRGVEFRKRSLAEEGVHLCEPEQGLFLDEDDEKVERPIESLMGYVESSDQHEDVLTEEANEAKEPYVFKYDILCMFAGTEEREGRQIHNSVIEKEETTLSHEDDQYLDHFLLSDAEMEEQLQELVVAENKEEDEGQHSDIVLTDFEEELKVDA